MQNIKMKEGEFVVRSLIGDHSWNIILKRQLATEYGLTKRNTDIVVIAMKHGIYIRPKWRDYEPETIEVEFLVKQCREGRHKECDHILQGAGPMESLRVTCSCDCHQKGVLQHG